MLSLAVCILGLCVNTQDKMSCPFEAHCIFATCDLSVIGESWHTRRNSADETRRFTFPHRLGSRAHIYLNYQLLKVMVLEF